MCQSELHPLNRAAAVGDVLVGARDDPLVGGDVIGEHDNPVERRRWHRAGIGQLFRLFGAAPFIVDVDERPCPEEGITRDMRGISLGS